MGQKHLTDPMIQNIMNGSADIDKMMPLLRKEPGRKMRLLKAAKMKLKFYISNPAIAEKDHEAKERIENVILLVKEGCSKRSVPPVKTTPPDKPKPTVRLVRPEEQTPVAPATTELIKDQEVFARKYKSEITLIRHNMVDPPSKLKVASMLIRSLGKCKGEDKSPMGSAIYRIFHYVATHREELEKVQKKTAADKMIADAIDYNQSNVNTLIMRHRVKMPDHLMPKKREPKEKPETLGFGAELAGDVSTLPYQAPYGEGFGIGMPPKEDIFPVGRTEMPTGPATNILGLRGDQPAISVKEVEATGSTEVNAGTASEVVIKARGVEITIKFNGAEVSVGAVETEPETVEDEPNGNVASTASTPGVDEVVVHSMRRTRRNRDCFCYGCGTNINSPEVILVKIREEDEKIVPFHLECTKPGRIVLFARDRR